MFSAAFCGVGAPHFFHRQSIEVLRMRNGDKSPQKEISLKSGFMVDAI
jgi:hypothetical protein